jgi:hypothetical protein
MNFFCSAAEFDQYVTEMGIDIENIIKADINRAVREAWEIFNVETDAEQMARLRKKTA